MRDKAFPTGSRRQREGSDVQNFKSGPEVDQTEFYHCKHGAIFEGKNSVRAADFIGDY